VRKKADLHKVLQLVYRGPHKKEGEEGVEVKAFKKIKQANTTFDKSGNTKLNFSSGMMIELKP
jgi:hypothetical protein